MSNYPGDAADIDATFGADAVPLAASSWQEQINDPAGMGIDHGEGEDAALATPEELADMFGVTDPAEISDDLYEEYESWMEDKRRDAFLSRVEETPCDRCGRPLAAHHEESREDQYGNDYETWVCYPDGPASKEELDHFAKHGCIDLMPRQSLRTGERHCNGCGEDLPAVTS